MEIISPSRHPTESALKTRLSVSQIAQTLGITTNYAYMILRGDVLPSAELDQKLYKLQEIVMSENEKPNWPDDATKEEFQDDYAAYKAWKKADSEGLAKVYSPGRTTPK